MYPVTLRALRLGALLGLLVLASPQLVQGQQLSPILEETFGLEGVTLLPILPTDDEAFLSATLPSGGTAVVGRTRGRIYLSWYDAAGKLDTGRGLSGVSITDVEAVPMALSARADGSVMVFGSFPTTFSLIEIYPDVQPRIQTLEAPFHAIAAAFKADGGLYAVGQPYDPSGNGTIGVAKLTPAFDYDASFGVGGVRRYDEFSPSGPTSAMLTEGEGVLIFGGKIGGPEENLFLLQLLPDGTPDPAFGTSGSLERDVSADSDVPLAAARWPDGRIVTVSTASWGLEPPITVSRLSPSGALDASFGTGGTLHLAQALDVHEVLLMPGGYTMLVAETQEEPRAPVLVRITPDGMLDASFGADGVEVLSEEVTGGEARVRGARVIKNAIHLEGFVTRDTRDAFVLRLDASGQPDPALGAQGRLVQDVHSGGGMLRDLVSQTDGSLLVGGQNFVAKTTTRVALDPLFGDDGRILLTPASGWEEVWDVEVQPDGKILAAGQSTRSQDGHTAMKVGRWHADGTPDLGFCTEEGTCMLRPLSGAVIARSLALQADGKIVVAGYADVQQKLVLTRIHPDGRLDTEFGTQGAVVPSDGYQAHHVAVRPDGRIVVSGRVTGLSTVGAPRVGVWRFLPSGEPDNTFGTGGSVVLQDLSPGSERTPQHHLALQEDKIVVSGRYTDRAGKAFVALVRLDAAGIPDPFFGRDAQTAGALLPEGMHVTHHLLAAPDGTYTVAGRIKPPGAMRYLGTLAHVTADGTPDEAWGETGLVTLGDSSQVSPDAFALFSNGDPVVGWKRNSDGAALLARLSRARGRSTSEAPDPPPGISRSRIEPNPALHRAVVHVPVSAPEHVRATLYDVAGRRITRLYDAVARDSLEIGVELGDLPAGVYFIRVERPESSHTLTLVHL